MYLILLRNQQIFRFPVSLVAMKLVPFDPFEGMILLVNFIFKFTHSQSQIRDILWGERAATEVSDGHSVPSKRNGARDNTIYHLTIIHLITYIHMYKKD